MNTQTLIISTKELEALHKAEMSKIAKQTVAVQIFDDSDLFVFSSELLCLRIAYYFNGRELKVGKTSEGSWYIALYNYVK